MELDSFKYPDGLRYTKGHIWVKAKGNKAKIGITSMGASLAKEIVHIDLPEDGEEFAAGKPIATYETIKSVSEITLPFACTAVNANEKLLDNPSLINSDCYGDGWIAKVKFSADDARELLDVKEAVKNYKKLLDKEKERYRGIYD